MLAHREVVVERRRVGDEGERRPRLHRRWLLVDGGPIHLHHSRRRIEETGDQPNRGRLARPVVTDHRHAFARADPEVEVAERDELAVVPRQSGDVEDGRGAHETRTMLPGRAIVPGGQYHAMTSTASRPARTAGSSWARRRASSSETVR